MLSAQLQKKNLVEDISFNRANVSQDNTTILSGCTTSHTLPNLPSSCDTSSASKPKPYLHTPGSFVLCKKQRRRSSPGVQIAMAIVTYTRKMPATECVPRNADAFAVHALRTTSGQAASLCGSIRLGPAVTRCVPHEVDEKNQGKRHGTPLQFPVWGIVYDHEA